MPTRLLETRNDCLAPSPRADGTVKLLRSLIGHVVSTADPEVPADPGAPEVLLDAEVDGVRCMLIRLQTRGSAHAQIVLSPREQEIARMVAAGYPNKTIAAVLDISSWTVGTHLRRVFAKLGVGSRAAMVARLLEDSLIRQPSRVGEPLTHARK
ncbi:MAG TPA: helix-turn-helix transcriptional regulator [Pyrinomonadaceae bacterium]|nr:helix-turn-helix transcriptional regulator [Pyrinomonadaceae bacterium]